MKKVALLKSIDEVILPLVLLLGSRYFGVFLYALIAPFQFTVSSNFDLASLPFIKCGGSSNLIAANSFSWGLTAAVLGLTFGFIAFRNLYLHEDWLHPKQATYLHRNKMNHFIVNSREAFHQGISWGVVVLISMLLSVADFVTGVMSALAFGTITATNASLLALLLLGISRDFKLEGKKVK